MGIGPRVRRYGRDWLKRLLAHMNLRIERIGLRLQPIHYYSETPDRRSLAANGSQWARPLSMCGVEWDLDRQFDWVSTVTGSYITEVEGLAEYRDFEARDYGPGYGPIESLFLHCVVRSFAPRRVVEIGSGLSTMVTLHASRLNEKDGRGPCQITCVEPFPHESLASANQVTLVASPAQAVSAELFNELGEGDLLFIDSTHAVKTGSELTRIYLEVIPNLRPGVLVHIHDIYLPYNFAPDILFNLFDWQETTLVAGLLIGNRGLEVLASMSALHHDRRAQLRRVFSDYRPCDLPMGLSREGARGHFPSSLWLRVVPNPAAPVG